MIVIAHAGDWLVSLLYLVPIVVLLAVLGVAALRERRRQRNEGPDEAGSA
ncbi:MAG: hypothetical protein H0T43_00385 [Solirubrobacterales bacterium]|nr:hypothetical protein [Solirubrobacterales bacterium]